MSKVLARLLLCVSLVTCQYAWAVDESRIWLPKKYRSAKPKLMAAAVEAEQSQRCKKVVAAEMVARKNTADHYFFVVTCRDEGGRTYNLSYLYPMVGHASELIAEQLPKNAIRPGKVEVTESGVTPEQVQELCRNDMVLATDALDNVTVLEDLLIEPVPRLEEALAGAYSYIMPFTALNEFGNDTHYRADCQVSREGKVAISVSLEMAGAWTICRDNLQMETFFLKSVKIPEQPSTESVVDRVIYLSTGFSANDPAGNTRQFKAHCEVDQQGQTEVSIELDKDSVKAACLEVLQQKTGNMLGVVIQEDKITPLQQTGDEDERGYFAIIPFDAKNPGGRMLRYQAECQVDSDGRTAIQIKARSTAAVNHR